jgi:A/G-specific adenine glycosylase
MPTLDESWKRNFRRRLLVWYRRHRRELPWRDSADPYRVWLSEIMLQQTQVATVVAYFHRFVEALPTVNELAAADEQQVLRLWEGLGYYRRARQLHKAAQQIVELHGGRFPSEIDQVRALPGIGRYTAGAITSIAFGARQPILEANTIRLLSRLIGYRADVSKAAGQKRLWEVAETILPQKQVGDFNQGLMELGAKLCTPRNPSCDVCPVSELCVAKQLNLQDEIPLLRKPVKFEEVHEAAVVVRRRGKILLCQYREGGRWAGLWDFPRFTLQKRNGAARDAELVAKVADMTGVTISPKGQIATLKHGVTRFRITLHCHAATFVSARKAGSGRPPMQWLSPEDLPDIPLNTTGRRLSKLIEK